MSGKIRCDNQHESTMRCSNHNSLLAPKSENNQLELDNKHSHNEMQPQLAFGAFLPFPLLSSSSSVSTLHSAFLLLFLLLLSQFNFMVVLFFTPLFSISGIVLAALFRMPPSNASIKFANLNLPFFLCLNIHREPIMWFCEHIETINTIKAATAWCWPLRWCKFRFVHISIVHRCNPAKITKHYMTLHLGWCLWCIDRCTLPEDKLFHRTFLRIHSRCPS